MSSTMAGGITETGEPYSAFVSVLQNTVLIPFFRLCGSKRFGAAHL